MTRLVAIFVTLFLVAIPAEADVALWPEPVPGWTVIQVYGEIKSDDFATFERYTVWADPAATLVIVTGPGGNLSAGLRIGILVHQKKLIVGAMGLCSSSCALIWIAGETGRKFFYQDRPGVLTFVCFHEAHLPGDWRASAEGTAVMVKYLAALGYKQDMIEWAIAAVPTRQRCLTPELAKQFNADFWYNTEDGQHYTLPGDHGILVTTPLPLNVTTRSNYASPYERWGGPVKLKPVDPLPTTAPPSLPNEWPAAPGTTRFSPSLPNGWPPNPAAPLTKEELEREASTKCMYLNEIRKRACKEGFLKGTQR